ncbi:type II secretion system inner membrane protein GspF [bacterium]|nr:type II secretion system inner membrane protein GspF [candidate division CSSED10-310 bacterium]
MARFNYQATDRSGKQRSGIIEASNEAAVVQRLREQELLPLSISTDTARSKIHGTDIHLGRLFQRVRRRDVMDFTSKLSVLSDAGIQLDRSLAIAADLTENEKLKEIIRDVRRNVQGGSSFADALARHPKIFNRLYVNMVRSGETGGVLDTILQRLAGFLESSQQLRDKIVSESIYPVLLIVVGTAVVVLMVTFVLPKFTLIFQNMGADLPLPTKMLVQFTEFVKKSWFFILGAVAVAVVMFRQYIRSEDGRHQWDRLKLNLPVFGRLIQKIEVARFARTLGTLVKSGVPILQALSIVKETLTNEIIASSLLSVYSRLKEGGGLANPLKETGVFPPLAIHMIAVGEETGSFESMLIKVADTYENDVRLSVERAMALVEPALIITMGVVIGFVVVSMLLAVFSISDMPL